MRRFFLVVGLLVVASIAGFITYSLKVQKEATLNLLASHAVTSVILEYVYTHEAWPQSLADLDGIEYSSQFDWPSESEQCLKRVKVKFGVSLEEVAASTPAQFSFIVPNEPIYRNSFESQIGRIILSSKSIVDHKSKTE
ncbi:hypothetical protein AB1L42_22235 [Thalassoglobus sp. JC818]|uniref:hypothetical protein n=1 Tax=Thalassoglobus sp. JC818 TaxID=3232136 RepID=UPI00345B2374